MISDIYASRPVVPVNGTATIAPALLVADYVPTAAHRAVIRMLTVTNKSTTAVLAVLMKQAGYSFAGDADTDTILDGTQVQPGQTAEIEVLSRISLGIVASASCLYTGTLYDADAS